MTDYSIAFGKHLRTVRKRKRLTLRQLGILARCPHHVISRLEHGKQGLTWELACRLSEALGMSLDHVRRIADVSVATR
jgi:transcriptional regulator with XRE-family HTH domain